MRITSSFLAALLVAAAPMGAYANCVASPPTHGILTQIQMSNLMVGSTACVGTTGNWQNQEQHSGGIITDYKNGPPAPGNNDPTKAIGTYSIGTDGGGTNGLITYNYTGGGSFQYYILGATGRSTPPAGTYDFCTTVDGTAVTVAVKKSIGSCP